MRFLQAFRLPGRIKGSGVCLKARTGPLWRHVLSPLSQGPLTLEFEIRTEGGNERAGRMEVLLDTADVKQVEIGMEILEPHRGQGLGTRALHLMETHVAGAWGVEAVVVRVREDNARSRAFVEKAGYRSETGEGRNGMILYEKRIGNRR